PFGAWDILTDGTLQLSPQGLTASGISSGAFMAVQLQVAHASVFQGVGALAGGMWGCANGNSYDAQNVCMENPQKIDSKIYVEKVHKAFSDKKIEDPAEIQGKPFFVYAGSKDSTIRLEAALRLTEFIQALGGKVQIKIDVPAEHGFPTLDTGNECDKKGLPWIQNCNYDGAGAVLQALYGSLKGRGKALEANLQIFSQAEFQTVGSGLGDVGYIYIPTGCRGAQSSGCRLHVALHGCRMSPDFVKDAFYKQAGYNNWAEKNNIVVLYPSAKIAELNPRGCWDWFGYTGANYLDKDAKQIVAIKAMTDRLLQETNTQRKTH
ncbi:MAG: PHB depolymerase family esterase, partial [Bdellovibrio sp.]